MLAAAQARLRRSAPSLPESGPDAAGAAIGIVTDVIRQAPYSVSELNAIAMLFGVIAAARALVAQTRSGHIPSEARPALLGLGLFLGRGGDAHAGYNSVPTEFGVPTTNYPAGSPTRSPFRRTGSA